ncbi:MAG: oxalate/formate MFS antiporter, partial [Candidatus Eremiobacteraeota bacterium]|nr:oxalate/formate MFS antiporter [Candidatus Eremiobacteraeota bacterium]
MASDASGLRNRWVQLALGILAMIMIANLQYGWTLFVQPLQDAHGWKKAAIQQAFTLFVLLEVWLVPLNGWIVDRIGPRPSTAVAGVLVALGWGLCARADSLMLLYLGASLAGVGAGMVYGTMVGAAAKSFPDHRGLAVGATAAGFGAGAALTVIPISATIAHAGYAAAFATFGLAQGLVLILIALVLRAPDLVASPATPSAAAAVRQIDADFSPFQMLRTPQFYLLYAMFTMIATGLLFMTAQVAPLAKDFGLGKTQLHVAGLAFATLPFVLIVDNVLNGGSRVFFGWISDRVGRELTMTFAFALE